MKIANMVQLPYAEGGVLYNETHFLLVYGSLGVNKLKSSNMVQINGRTLSFLQSIYSFNIKNSYSMINDLFKNVLHGYLYKFRLIGRGYRVYVETNQLLFRLGYSHSVYYVMPLSIYLSKKEKNEYFWKFYGNSKHLVSQTVSHLKSFKLPDAYTMKGIMRQEENFNKKEGKKAYTL